MLKEFKKYPHCEAAYIYANHVIKGHKPACKEEKQSCQRFIDDLTRDFEYTFDLGKAEEACEFIELLPHTKGRWATKRLKIELEGWQCFIVCNLFGWVDDKGLRRFLEAYLKTPRKNGKSIIAAAIGVKLFCADGEFGAEVYSGATSEKQAWEVFKPARLMCLRTPELTNALGIEVNVSNLNKLEDASKFETMIGNPGDGSMPHCALVDEYHEHPTDRMVSTMQTGMGAREQPLLLITTTSGDNIAGPCYQAEIEYKKLLDQDYIDDRVFVMMYGIDEGDDWTQPEALIKANPNYDISVDGDWLLHQQQVAIRNPVKQYEFQRKHLNLWVNSLNAFLNMDQWAQCAEDLNIEEFVDDKCVFCLDLSSRIDITAFMKVFARDIDGKLHYYVFSEFYLPEETIYKTLNQHYQGWMIAGHMNSIDGDEIDFNKIQSVVEEQYDQFTNVVEIAHDEWKATQLSQALEDYGATTVEMNMNVKTFSEPMYELEAAIESKRFHHDGNPVLTWMASNLVARRDAKDNVYPRKEKPENKIDGIVALLMGVNRLMLNDDAGLNDFLSEPISS